MELFLKHIEQMRRFFEAHEVVVTIQVVPVQELAAYDARWWPTNHWCQLTIGANHPMVAN
jgi:hypothetical protein